MNILMIFWLVCSHIAFQTDCGICPVLQSCIQTKILKDQPPKILTLNLAANRDTLCKLGLQTGFISDSAVTGSSYLHPWNNDHHPNKGRLDRFGIPGGLVVGAWVAGNSKVNEWIQVELQQPTTITGVITQGRNLESQWVTKFKVEYNSKTDQIWKQIRDARLKEEFWGNTDSDTKVLNMFDKPVQAIRIRIVVLSWNSNIALRHEYLTC